MRFFPQRRSPYWFLWGAVLAIFVSLLYMTVYTLGYGRDMDYLNIPGIILIFMILCQLIALGGFLGFYLYLALSATGFILGLAMFLGMLTPSQGFEDLVGAISFLFFSAIGVAAGIVTQMLYWGWRKYKENR